MGKNLLNSLGAKLSQLKVMCGLSVDSAAKEEQAVAAVRRDPIPAASFVAVYRHRHLDQRLGTEFKAVSKNQEDHPTAAAMRNVLNNVKQDIVPYDHSRVKLTYCPLPDTTNDYINASYIDGYSLLREYIATQGPSGKTVAAFWHMVWQEGIRCIVMATGLFDNAVQQCDKYWNDMASSHRYVRHGDIHIWNEDSVFMARLNIRTFRIQREGGFEQRLVRQYEMVGFREENPDPGLLLDVRRRVNSFTQHAPGPILVHCRCGGGRSAVFLAVDYCLKQLEMEDVVDVYSAVLHLRRFRKNMIRTVSQYGQVYAAVAMHLQCGETVYPVSLLPTAYTSYYSRQVDPSHSKLEKEYQMLKVIVPRLSIGDCASGHRVENRNKSRDIMMLPPERARPYLMTTEQGENATDFINAVYVDGYHQENTFLVTQWPKKHTINDLWRLLFDFKITSLVVLNEVKFSRTYPRFWPKELDCEVRYGPISVRYLGCGKYPNVIVRAFAIHKCPKFDYHVPGYLFKVSRRAMMLTNIPGCEIREDDLVVKMFQVCGGGTRKPSKGRVALPPKSLLATLEAAEGWQQKNNPLNPICVLSKDGASRCGIFCAVHMCCDQVKNDGEVDVFNAVRLVRHNRPQLVTTVDEYRYIYSFMTDYIRSTVSQRPQIVITGAEGDNLANRNASKQPADGLSTDDSLSCISSQAGSFETALDEVMDSMLPDSAEVQSRLTACNSQLSPHLSGRIHLGADGCSFPSTDSLSSGPGPHPHEALSSVGFMAASIANAFAPDTVSHNTVLSNNVNHHHKNCAHSKDRVLEQNWHANHVSHMSDRSPLIGGVCVRDRNAAVVGNHIACRASVPECVCERAEKPEKKLERRNTNDSFHSVGSSLHLWQT
ncbi:receptor-type tyrosine-protein phosphatase kappa-like isoform X2 [Babylonia areolata]|uniref:receptor-type tyrosine-protein phosphatase kappa-like isoform X2 n=1 Tax=Babylonia areolata TaxID=304850 RepID=UPI003FD277C8